jgi:phenylacetate-CoA ligase
MRVKVERNLGQSPEDDKNLSETIGAEIRKQIMVRAELEIVDYGSLPRTERKSKRVFDNRS